MKTQLENANTIPAVYTAIVNVMHDMGAISKSRKNAQQGYLFRGVDDVLNSMQPLLIKHNLIILPEVNSRTEIERTSKSGGIILQVVVNMKFTLISAIDGSTLVTNYTGEGMDSGDKATNKAMSTAYKYFAFQVFCIPTEEAKDSEIDTPEIAKKPDAVVPTVSKQETVKPNPEVAEDDNKQWLNLVDKQGNKTEKGNSAITFILSGGKVSEIAKKYKLSKSVRAELAEVEKLAEQHGYGEKALDAYFRMKQPVQTEESFDEFGNYDTV